MIVRDIEVSHVPFIKTFDVSYKEPNIYKECSSYPPIFAMIWCLGALPSQKHRSRTTTLSEDACVTTKSSLLARPAAPTQDPSMIIP